jgi:riboflavin kinase/FMN adenylyltransferase
MKIFYGIDHLPQFSNAVLTVGTFDGVHEGHQSILKQVVAETIAIKGSSIVITFDPHPRKLIFPNDPIKLLSSLDERLSLLSNSGIDVVIVVPFTKEFSLLSAQQYIEQFLVKLFHPRLIVIGYDHHFGNDRKGNIELLKAFSSLYHYEVKEIPAKLISAAAISSTQIRKSLLDGSIEWANNMLGLPYQITGKVVKGAQRGKEIGFPTANIELLDQNKLLPKTGVYAVKITVDQKVLNGMLNIGFNPTFSNDNLQKIEVHIFDFNADIYDSIITISFFARIRAEQKFESVQKLVEQLRKDKLLAKKALRPIL